MLSRVYTIENNPVFSSINKGFILIIPIVIAGSIGLLLNNFPIPAFQAFIRSFWNGFLGSLFVFIFDSTVGFISAFLVLSVSYYYSATFINQNSTRQALAMFTSLACFAASFGAASGSLELSSFGTVGVFTAMVCAIAATRLFFALEEWLIPKTHSYAQGVDVLYHHSMTAIFPVLCCVTTFALANWLLTVFFGVNNFNDLIANGLVALFRNIDNELANGVLFTLMLNILWFFGIHGGNALDQVAQTIFAAGESSLIISKSFWDNFSVIGGCGATTCLLIAILIVSRSKANRRLAYSAAPMMLFNMNEILVYGLPIVLNPIMMIPFILVPLVSLFIAYFAVLSGFMPLIEQSVLWTTPVLYSGYLASGSIRGAVVQLVIVIVGTAIYLPFMRLYERSQDRRTAFMLEELTEQFKRDQAAGTAGSYLPRRDNIGLIAKSLVNRLQFDIENHFICMHYQPQVDANGKLIGAEALLRWKYMDQIVFPPLIIALAKEDGCMDALTWEILALACAEIKEICGLTDPKLEISVNIDADHLDNPAFVHHTILLAVRHNTTKNLVLEVTEETSLKEKKNIAEHIGLFTQSGISLAIDDFSMGQTSLDYLRNNHFRYVKLDGNLVRQVVDNLRVREIISSIVTLGKNLGFQIITEYVETQEIQDTLLSLGCDYFQGYLYSPALPKEYFLRFAAAKAPNERAQVVRDFRNSVSRPQAKEAAEEIIITN